MPPGDPARLFDKFQRGDGEGAIVGVGLGLAICQAIIRAHGGEIAAQRRTPHGARFELTLPMGTITDVHGQNDAVASSSRTRFDGAPNGMVNSGREPTGP